MSNIIFTQCFVRGPSFQCSLNRKHDLVGRGELKYLGLFNKHRREVMHFEYAIIVLNKTLKTLLLLNLVAVVEK